MAFYSNLDRMESNLSEAIRDPQSTGTEHFRFGKTKEKKISLQSCYSRRFNSCSGSLCIRYVLDFFCMKCPNQYMRQQKNLHTTIAENII